MFGPDVLERHLPERPEPWCEMFNAMTMTMARRSNPLGWYITESYVKAPHSLADLNTVMNTEGKLTIWGGASDYTVYACPEHNAAARAWHGMVHWFTQAPMTLAGEAVTAYVQIWQMLQQYGHDEQTEDWAAVLLTEVIGQALYKYETGEFPLDQLDFLLNNKGRFERVAKEICLQLSPDSDEVEPTWCDAAKLAMETWGCEKSVLL
jgi:hypothetical protein